MRENLEAGVRDAGFAMDDIAQVVVTHIHLDHAGGVGELLRTYPEKKVWVHPVGAPHLIDPARLIESATRIYADDMLRLWGDIDHVREGQIAVAEDRVAIDIGGRKLIPYFTPGHASHHLALLDEQTGSLFTGDVAGARMQGTVFTLPPMPPPDIDLDAWRASIHLMRELAPEQLLLAHFGAFSDVDSHLAVLGENLDRLMAMGRSALIPDGRDEALTSKLQAWVSEELGDDADRVEDSLEAANPIFMTSMGIHRVLRKGGELEA